MKRYLIAGNWKMNKTPGEGVALAREIKKAVEGVACDVMVAPSFTALAAVTLELKGSNVKVGAQNMAAEEEGAFTGETSVVMLKELDVEYVIVGHSERRHVFGESDEMINAKMKLGLRHGMTMVLCIGETLEERESGEAEKVCFRHLEKGLEGIPEDQLSKVVIAYEPVWAIGTGKTATPDDADAIHAACRKKLAELYSTQSAQDMVIQYGGSVNPGNVKELMAMENIDGGLIGGASLKADSFAALVNFDK